MSLDRDGDGRARFRITIRSNAPQSKADSKLKMEEFQICGDARWENRLYPTGGPKEEVVVIRAGDRPSQASVGGGKGHGRNWAVEGRPGTSFDIALDPQARTVACETPFREHDR